MEIFLVFEFGGLTQSCRLFLLSSKGILINTYQLLSLLPDKSLAHLHTATLSIPIPFQEVRGDHTWSWPTVPLTSTHPAPHQHLCDTPRQNPGLRKSPSPPFPNFTISISENPFTEHKLLPSPAKPTLYLPSDWHLTATICTSYNNQDLQSVSPYTLSLLNFFLIKDIVETFKEGYLWGVELGGWRARGVLFTPSVWILGKCVFF